MDFTRNQKFHPFFWFQMKKSKCRSWHPLPAVQSWPWKCLWPCSPSTWAELLPAAFMDPSRPTLRSESWQGELSLLLGRWQMFRYEYEVLNIQTHESPWPKDLGPESIVPMVAKAENPKYPAPAPRASKFLFCRSLRTSEKSPWWCRTRQMQKIAASDCFARLPGTARLIILSQHYSALQCHNTPS